MTVTSASEGFAQPSMSRTFGTFAEVKDHLIEMFGQSKSRIWLLTDYLSDGDVVSSLYLAKYRKTEVQVLLGKHKANHYLSRLGFLQKQNIPVHLIPDGMSYDYPSQILIDNRLLLLDSEIDFKLNRTRYTVVYGNESMRGRFVSSFANALNLKIPALFKDLPLVGSPRHSNRPQRGWTYYPPPADEGTYRYQKRYEPRPAEAPQGLPSQTVWQKKMEQKTNDQKDGNIEGKP
jgi:phosphatidylserine/phosphatidylglycerophosphate/cardiolipin synthase-like enzyme